MQPKRQIGLRLRSYRRAANPARRQRDTLDFAAWCWVGMLVVVLVRLFLML